MTSRKFFSWCAPTVLTLAAMCLCAGPVLAEGEKASGWPQWRGPNGDGISAAAGWTTDWPRGGLKPVWKTNVGAGYSAVSVSGGKLYTMGNKDNQDTVTCLNAGTGEEIWKKSYPCKAGDWAGTRSTPTVVDGVVYTLSREGLLCAFGAEKGDSVWTADLRKELALKVPGWGIAGSPLVEGDKVIVNVGKAGAAVDRKTGKVVWSTGGDQSGYATPVAFTLRGKRFVTVFGATALYFLNPADGAILWSLPWTTESDVHAADPIVSGDMMFISSGYGTGCALLDMSGDPPKVVYTNKNMANHFSTCVLKDGYLYGVTGNTGQGTLVCMEMKTGKVQWTKGGLKMGALMIADGKLIVSTDNGTVFVAEADPKECKVLATTPVVGPTCWTMPVLADGKIYVRNAKGDLACVDVSKK